ncbi:MAG: asparagine synthase (glutamine-hydrolyzing) [Desulfobulbaceae bacterium]|nr:asparagine synthase (glutamine-hydrolyzing) [Pseudomonadota bacterium]MCG2746197.1 asparagine synthase (glutamine-hydrolyzing) [Desulfobulbaceae bacterium]
MCGIAGFFNISSDNSPGQNDLERMIYPVAHRGPDGYGFYVGNEAGLAHARLSIIDLEGGWQPIHNEDKSLWVIFNGEIFNYRELRKELEAKGHRFYTNSDTEVIVHLYEENREECLSRLNGQFAIALYDVREKALILARDRMGIRPLFYVQHEGLFYFASEIKSLFAANSSLPREMNLEVLREVFTLWMPGGTETIFKGVHQLEAGHWARISVNKGFVSKEYWDIPFGIGVSGEFHKEADYAEKLRELLIDSVRLRLRADVPVGAYLSGGLDSSTITSLIHHYTDNPLKTFSVTFSDRVYDEQAQQKEMVDFLATDHHVEHCTYEKIGESFPDVIWHTEMPILRTAPAPLYLLSSLVRKNHYKVVLTGEGADEILGGYDIFKEAKIRAFIKKDLTSSIRPMLLKRLYPYLALSPTKSAEFAKIFFNTDASIDDLFYAHMPRWKTTGGTSVFFAEKLKRANVHHVVDKLISRFSHKLVGLDYFSRAQYLEAKLLLGNYLLSSQGDRMAMAHSVEGRFPFLDHRLVEFACTIPPNMKMKVLNEKNILKKAMDNLLPKSIVKRKKQPYMAPDILSFFGGKEPEYLNYYLSPQMVKEAGFFNPRAVEQLLSKCRKKVRQGFRENMAFVGILSTQIVYEKFVKNFRIDMPNRLDNIKIIS